MSNKCKCGGEIIKKPGRQAECVKCKKHEPFDKYHAPDCPQCIEVGGLWP